MKDALILSLILSAVTALLLTIFAIFSGFILTFFNVPFKNFILSLFFLPVLLPPTVLGFFLLYVFNPKWLIGALYENLTGRTLLFSFEGLILASIIYSLPFALFPVKDAFERVDRRLIEIAFIFGYSKFSTFIKVVLPNSLNGIFTAFILVFSRTMGEFGTVLMVGGNIPGETQTLSIYIYDQVQSLNYEEAKKASLILLLLSLSAFSFILFLERRWRR